MATAKLLKTFCLKTENITEDFKRLFTSIFLMNSPFIMWTWQMSCYMSAVWIYMTCLCRAFCFPFQSVGWLRVVCFIFFVSFFLFVFCKKNWKLQRKEPSKRHFSHEWMQQLWTFWGRCHWGEGQWTLTILLLAGVAAMLPFKTPAQLNPTTPTSNVSVSLVSCASKTNCGPREGEQERGIMVSPSFKAGWCFCFLVVFFFKL